MSGMSVGVRARDAAARLVCFRRELHAHPELSGAEVGTAARVARMLYEVTDGTSARRTLHERLGGGYGLLFVLDYGAGADAKETLSSTRPRTVVFRCELDAVPVPETPPGEECGVSYGSVVPGVAHKCGHDGHMAMMVGLAGRLAHGEAFESLRSAGCRVAFLFQGAEETAEGAKQALLDERFAALQPEFLLAVHNQPGHPVGVVLARAGTAACGSVGFVARLGGVQSHACFPERGCSPARAIGETVEAMEALRAHPSAAGRLAFATVVHAQVGEAGAFGVAPGAGVVMATIRADGSALLEELKEFAELRVQEIARARGLTVDVSWQDAFGVTVNDAAAVRLVEAAANARGMPFVQLPEPMRWAEDFGFILERFPHGALVCVGSGESQAALHHPAFDFPDLLVDHGVGLLECVALAAVRSSVREDKT